MGFPWRQLAHYAEVFAPMVLAETPLAPIAGNVGQAIKVAEQSTDPTLPDAQRHAAKLAAAVQDVRLGLDAYNKQAAATGHPLIDPALSDHAIGAAVSAVVDVVNIKQGLHPPAVPPVAAPASSVLST